MARRQRKLTDSQRMQSEYLKRPRGLPFTRKFLHNRTKSGANSINNTIDQKQDDSMVKAANGDPNLNNSDIDFDLTRERSKSLAQMEALGLNNTLARLESAFLKAQQREEHLVKELEFSFHDGKLDEYEQE